MFVLTISPRQKLVRQTGSGELHVWDRSTIRGPQSVLPPELTGQISSTHGRAQDNTVNGQRLQGTVGWESLRHPCQARARLPSEPNSSSDND